MMIESIRVGILIAERVLLSNMIIELNEEGKVMGIRLKIENKAMDTQSIMAAQAQAKYLTWLMKEESCSYEEALAIVQGRTDPLEPEYMLGYKLADPVWMIAIFKQLPKKNRIKAAHNFSELLTEEERILFWNEVFDEKNAKQFKKQYKEAKKEKGLKDDTD